MSANWKCVIDYTNGHGIVECGGGSYCCYDTDKANCCQTPSLVFPLAVATAATVLPIDPPRTAITGLSTTISRFSSGNTDGIAGTDAPAASTKPLEISTFISRIPTTLPSLDTGLRSPVPTAATGVHRQDSNGRFTAGLGVGIGVAVAVAIAGCGVCIYLLKRRRSRAERDNNSQPQVRTDDLPCLYRRSYDPVAETMRPGDQPQLLELSGYVHRELPEVPLMELSNGSNRDRR